MKRRARSVTRVIIAVLVILTGGGAVGSIFGAIQQGVSSSRPLDGEGLVTAVVPTPQGPVINFGDEAEQQARHLPPTLQPGLEINRGMPTFSANPTPPSQAVLPPAEPPAAARKLEPGDVDLLQLADGTLRATADRPASMSCEGNNLIKVESQGETFYISIPTSEGWHCGVALERWRKVSASDKAIGIRLAAGTEEGQDAVTLVDQSGASMFMMVTGAWRQ